MTRSGAQRAHRLPAQRLLWLVIAFAIYGSNAEAQGTVTISMPVSVSFQVVNVNVSASTGPTSISFSSASLPPGQALRISVKAESDLIPPSGPAIPASKVSWTTSSVSNGIGINGTLSASVYSQVFESQANATSGGVDLSWTLSAPGTPRRAGNHQATLRWKLEAITP